MRPSGHGVLLMVIAGAFALTACSDGRAKSTSDADYVDTVAPLVSGCDAEQATDNAALGRILKQRSTAWDAIHPPASLAPLHTAYAKALGKAADEFLKSPATNADLAAAHQAFNTSQIAYRDWYSAFSDMYGDRLFRVEGSSMTPAMHDGVVLPIDPPEEAIKRWDVVIFKFPLDPSRDFIKRVVGLPGETIEVRDGKIYANGAVVDGDTYAKDTTDYIYAPKTVPDDSYWVLGDNRGNSFDSHAWGNSCNPQQQCDFVPKNLILGVLPEDTKGCRSAPTS